MSIDQLAAPDFLPFLIAAGVLLGLIVLELVTMLLGAPLSHLFGHFDHLGMHHHGVGHDWHAAGGPDHGHAHAHHPEARGADARGPFSAMLDWINIGRVPFLVLLMVLLAAFAAVGIFIQTIAASLLMPLPWPAAVAVAVAAALPATRASSRFVARMLPRDETYSTSEGELVGLTGEVTLGPARVGVVAKARFRDRHGNTHFTRVEPFEAADTIEQGAIVLAVELRGRVLAVTRADPALVPERS
jgi:membrane protein implicated in regulation of membrane protease activity